MNLLPGRCRPRSIATWNKSIPIRWRVLPGVPAPVTGTNGTADTLSVSATNLSDPHLPKFAPRAVSPGGCDPVFRLHDFAEISAVMAPLYAKASTPKPDGAVVAEATRIAHATRRSGRAGRGGAGAGAGTGATTFSSD